MKPSEPPSGWEWDQDSVGPNLINRETGAELMLVGRDVSILVGNSEDIMVRISTSVLRFFLDEVEKYLKAESEVKLFRDE